VKIVVHNKGSKMNNTKLIIFLVITIFYFSHNFAFTIKGFCGLPNVPFNAKLNPKKDYYLDGDEVLCNCENINIDFIQSRKCQRGEWTEPKFICGMK
jgi:hypothetical protein